jgi:tRNA-5-methyluridine54 2-sulfurtransferase
MRRYLVNTSAKALGASVVATGHNLDDEAQTILMNLFRNQLEISARLGPKSGLIKDARFIPRVKPLYHCLEKEICAYSHLTGARISFVECPYAAQSFRAKTRELLNQFEEMHPGTKSNIISSYLKMLPEYRRRYDSSEKPAVCPRCYEPSKQGICRMCQILEKNKY